jgi:hypothetical protein
VIPPAGRDPADPSKEGAVEIEGLASLDSSEKALVTAYVDPAAGPAPTVMGELSKVLRGAAESGSREAAMSIRADIARLERLASRFAAQPAPGWVAALAHHAGIEEVRRLPTPVPSHVSVGRRPYLRPLRALPLPLRALVAVIERPRVVLFSSGEDLVEMATVESELGKDNFGGFRGYEETKAAHRFEEESVRIWREAASIGLKAHGQEAFDMVVVAGHRHDLNHFVEQLHPYLRGLPVFSNVVDPATVTPPQLLDIVRASEPEVRRRADEEAIQTVLGGAYEGKPVARGTTAVLNAVNIGAVDRMVISGPFAKDGVVCPACGWLARTGERCEPCGSATDCVDDVIAPAIETTIARGGIAKQVAVASPLDAEGVAALLHFPM